MYQWMLSTYLSSWMSKALPSKSSPTYLLASSCLLRLHQCVMYSIA